MSELTQEEEAYADIEMARALSEAEKAAFDSRLAELQVQKQEYEILETQLNLKYQLDGIFNFDREVNRKSMVRLFKDMRLCHMHNGTAPWVINLNSPGGDTYSALGIIDEIMSYSIRGGGSHHIEIRVRGLAASAAGMILQTADRRVMGHTSKLMIHRGSGGILGDADQIIDEGEWWKRTTEDMADLFLSRTDKITRNHFLRKINRKDWWLSATEALELGFCDAIG